MPNDGRAPRGAADISKDPGSFILKQRLVCEDVLFCPDNIAKLVVKNKEDIRYCTGVLIGVNKLLTSASCLPKSLRIPNLGCSETVFAVFPKTPFGDEEIVRCQEIEAVDNNQFSGPALWKSDLAIIKLNRNVARSVSGFSRDGVVDSEELISWKVNSLSTHMSTLVKSKCTTLLNTYLNPFSQEKSSPMFVVSDCESEKGNVGAPLFRGDEIVGIYSQEMNSRIYDFLKTGDLITEKIGRYYHYSNILCGKKNNFVTKTGFKSDCAIETSVNELDSKRSKIFTDKTLHLKEMAAIKENAELGDKYFHWDLDFYYDRDLVQYEAHLSRPKCILKIETWIQEFRRWRGYIRTYAKVYIDIPHYVFKIKLNRFLKPVSVLENTATKTYEVEFNPFEAYINRSTYVTITSSLRAETSTQTYEDVSDSCNSL